MSSSKYLRVVIVCAVWLLVGVARAASPVLPPTDGADGKATAQPLRAQQGDAPICKSLQEPSAAPLPRWPTRLADWRFSLTLAVAILATTAAILTIARRRHDDGHHRTA